MAMLGIPLSVYKEELHHIPEGVLPTRTIERFEERLLPYKEELEWCARQYTTTTFDPFVHCHGFPEEFYDTCTFEELSKIYATSFIQLPQKFDKVFEKDPEYYLVHKIKNSIWRWGYGRAEESWNQLVDAHNGIRNFSFELPGFEVTLDYTTGCNEYSCGTYDRSTYLDGVFGFRVHYRGEHVLTIGFSIARDGRLLLAQVQLKKAKGNRFLYKLPMHHVPYVVGLLKKQFPSSRLYLVDGDTAIKKYLQDYRSSLLRSQKMRREGYASKGIKDWVEGQIAYFEEHINDLEGEGGERIRRAYQLTVGDHRLSQHQPFECNKFRFWRIIRA